MKAHLHVKSHSLFLPAALVLPVLLLVVCCCFILEVPALAKDIYVRGAVASTGDGSKDNPYSELWKALDKCVRGDVIHVAAGTYTGKGGSGAFIIKVPNLTLFGGYDANFSRRNPFQYPAILERAGDYRGDWTGLPEGIIDGPQHSDHSGLVVDGFVLDSRSRNAYKTNGDIDPRNSWKGTLFHCYSANIKIKNCILLNPYGDGIYCTWAGQENEIDNCFILNTFYTAISTRSAQKDAVIKIKNCTIGFVWSQPGKEGGTSLLIGRLGQVTAENNIFMFNQAFAVNNSLGNEDTILKNNIFFQCQGGYYKFMDNDGQNLLLWKPGELDKLNQDAESYMLLEAGNNSDKDPGLKPDKDYYEKFSNFVASTPGKLNMDSLNQWRRSVGLPLQAEPGSPRKNWGMAYPLRSVIPNLVPALAGNGAALKDQFPVSTSTSTPSAATGTKETATSYQVVLFDGFKKGAAGVKNLAGQAVEFKAGLGDLKYSYLLAGAPRSDYDCVMLLKPGEKVLTRNFIYGYLLKGSEAHKNWQKFLKKRDTYNASGGIVIKGKAWYLGSEAYPYPVGVIIDTVDS